MGEDIVFEFMDSDGDRVKIYPVLDSRNEHSMCFEVNNQRCHVPRFELDDLICFMQEFSV